jgi:hypothetical protein
MANWTWTAASARGTSHEANGEGRQDAFRVLSAADFLVAIACDGAGSACRGRLGAVIATRILSARAADWISRRGALPSPGALDLWVAEVRLTLLVHADRLGCKTEDFAATLALAISDGTSTITAHVGDGAIVGRCAGSGDLVALSWPDSGEYASTTYFLTDDVVRLRIGVTDAVGIDRLAVLTDGLERLALDLVERVAHPPFFTGMFAAVAASSAVGRDAQRSSQLAAFLASDTVNARTDDDKTLILAAVR